MNQFELFDFYLLRMPVFPYSNILKPYTSTEKIVNELYDLTHQPIFKEAIFLASEELYMEMQKWNNKETEIKKDKVRDSLYKYYLRMATRSTPYGLFAGCCLGSISKDPTNITLKDVSQQKLIRLDSSCYTTLVENIPFEDEELLKKTIFYTNTSIYSVGETYRYYEYKTIEGSRSYYLSSFSKNEFINEILFSATSGNSFSNLLHILLQKNVAEEESIAFLKTLIENQILTGEYSTMLTGGNQLDRLITALSTKQPLTTNMLANILSLKEILTNKQDIITKYTCVATILKKCNPTIKEKDCLQADVFFNLKSNNIKDSSLQKIVLQIEQLLPLNIINPATDLHNFKTAFYNKFEDREIPLFEALDSDVGVGYGEITGEKTCYTPLIDDLTLHGKDDNKIKKWSYYEDFILKKFIENEKHNGNQIDISAEEMEMLLQQGEQQTSQRLPATFSILGTIFCNSQKALDDGSFNFLLKNCGGNSAASLISRFGSENDAIENAIATTINYEKEVNKDKILAEIIHLPEGRIGNVLVRPKTFDYEIPFLATASTNSEFTIPISDLFIAIKQGRILLISKKLNKEILPRLTSAHNFSLSLPVYKFLCDLQFQDESFSIGWDWGVLDKMPFLPRVVYKNIILRRARWLLTKVNYTSPSINNNEWIKNFQQKYKMPNVIVLVEGDNELLLDITNEISVSILTTKISKGDVIVYEFLHKMEGAMVADNNNLFGNEIIIPVKNNSFKPIPVSESSHSFKTSEKTFFTPGSEWLYLKIYAGFKSMDSVLSEIIAPLTVNFKTNIDKWFFIRYKDPESHLRVRFNVKNRNAYDKIIKAIDKAVEPYIKNRIIHKIEYATYFQEVEKYPLYAMEVCETFFYEDSKVIINIVDFIYTHKVEEIRWLVAVKGVDEILNNFKFTVLKKKQLMNIVFLSFFKEFNGDKNLMIQLNTKYRNKKDNIHVLFQDWGTLVPPEIVSFVEQKSIREKEIYSELVYMIKKEKDNTDAINTIVNNLIHLFLNRLFVANHRLHEMVVYHHLFKHYESALARTLKK